MLNNLPDPTAALNAAVPGMGDHLMRDYRRQYDEHAARKAAREAAAALGRDPDEAGTRRLAAALAEMKAKP